MCGTDQAIWSGEFRFVRSGDIKFPMTLGHEWCGVVAQVGSHVERFKVGDRVVGDTGVSCGLCPACLSGEWPHCPRAQAVGTINAWDGAYAEHILMPERHLFHLPQSIGLDNGALVEPAATALLAVKRAGVSIGDTVLVQGSGPIGIAAAKLSKLCGASCVLITGRRAGKLEKALALGIDAAIHTREEDIAQAVRRHTGEAKVDRIIEASGSTDLFTASLELLRPGGTLALVAFYEQVVSGFDIDGFVFGDVNLRAVTGSTGMYPVILRLMAAGMLDLSSVITARFPLDLAPQAMGSMERDAATRIKIMLEP